eukprot:42099-Rhodomonas_salina.2
MHAPIAHTRTRAHTHTHARSEGSSDHTVAVMHSVGWVLCPRRGAVQTKMAGVLPSLLALRMGSVS